MKNVALKPDSQRIAQAQTVLYAPPDCIELLRSGTTEKGDALKTARVAGILAAKRTDELIPMCHPLPIYRADVLYELGEDHVRIIAEVETIGATGVEMEALTAASLAALTLYDMLKPHCEPEQLWISDCKLLEKHGGKSHFTTTLRRPYAAAVVVLSDTVAAGRKPDTAGRQVCDQLQQAGFAPIDYQVIADDADQLNQQIDALLSTHQLIVTVGGTGLGPRDITVQTLQPRLTRSIPGLMEAARAFGQRRTPYAALSRGIAGYIGETLLLTLPGSRRGAQESLVAILPALVHLFDVQHNVPHPGGYH